MKHLKKIEELYKSTYHSASKKLKSKHPNRAKEIISWAKEKGKSEFSKDDISREFPFGFDFKNNKYTSTHLDFLLGTFYITGSKRSTVTSSGYYGLEVNMMNDWGQKITLEVSWGVFNEFSKMLMKIGNGLEIGKFLFDNRNDARNFSKYVNETTEDLDMPYFSVPVNELYYTG